MRRRLLLAGSGRRGRRAPAPAGRGLLLGAVAGAAGTVALDVVSYLDMVLRARPPSGLPAEVAGRLADRAGVELGEGERAGNRRSGIGALLGYASGLGLGLLYGALRPRARLPLPAAGAALGAAAMAASDVPATALGATDPRTWSAADWAADILPHLAYGLVAAAAFDAAWRGNATA